MCGVGGIYRPSGLSDTDRSCLNDMAMVLAHRGPDAVDQWVDGPSGLGLVHRRLAVLDVSEAGAQPMRSASGRYMIAYNGEIYNFADLRKSLEESGKAPDWRGHSDTEIFLAAIDAWGLHETLTRLRGMFAFALWDCTNHRLFLGRDAMGEKPLYLATLPDGGLLFASELKALRTHADFDGQYDRDAIAQCLRLGYIAAPRTLYLDVRKVMHGSFVEISSGRGSDPAIVEHIYFDLLDEAAQASSSSFRGSADDAVSELENLLSLSIQQQMISDVPLGAFLSGGIDSSTITALMHASGTSSVKTFALGFNEDKENEAHHARRVAEHLGTDHHEIVLPAEDALALVSRMPDVYDEPFADPSQLPTYLVSQFARQQVTVCLSGDGADELLGGYGRYHSVRRRRSRTAARKLQRMAESAYFGGLATLAAGASAVGVRQLGTRDMSVKALQMSERALRARQDGALKAYEQGYTRFDQAHKLVTGASRIEDDRLDAISSIDGLSHLGQLTLFDLCRYLPDDILVKVDRAAMAHSLETRAPFLNVDVVRFALSLPDTIKLADGQKKGVLKNVLGRHVPRSLWDRPKQGFGIPVDQWLRGPFRDMAEELFSANAIKRSGVLDAEMMQRLWNDFLRGNKRLKTVLWSAFIVQLTLLAK